MSKYLIVHATRYGQTEKISNFMAQQILSRGHSYDLFSIDDQIKDIKPDGYDGVIVGGAVYGSHFKRKLEDWCRANHDVLNEKPSAFFSVCLGILQKDIKVQKKERQISQRFLDHCFWHPQTKAIFAGGLTYSKYNRLLKWMMWMIAKRAGQSTLRSKDYDYTDWAQVEKFVDDFLQGAAPH